MVTSFNLGPMLFYAYLYSSNTPFIFKNKSFKELTPNNATHCEAAVTIWETTSMGENSLPSFIGSVIALNPWVWL